MKPEAPEDALAQLDPAARLRAPGPRMRLGVGAAVVLLIIAVVAAVVISMMGQPAQRSEVAPNTGSSSSGEATGDPNQDASAVAPGGVPIFVHVLGAVRHPGLFELHDGARVMDAVAAAGGLTESADPAGVNLARIVGDGEQLYVPQRGEAQPGAPPGAPPGAQPNGTPAGGGAPVGPLNLNTATVADLDTLPRIGPALAQRIIDYREANGRFTSVDDLRSVTGIGEKTFEGLKDLVRV